MNKKLLRKKLALMLANLKKKRPYYIEIEFLENTGTASARNWISTGIVPDTTTKWEVRIAFNNTSTGKLMGSGYANPNRFNIGIESNKFRFAFNAWFDANSNITTPDTNAHTWIMDAPSKTFTIDKYSITSTQTFGTTTIPICLFGRGYNADGNTETSNAVAGKIYYSKIWQDGVLVRDMIPVLDWNYVPCMYDKVSGELFYNKGTGSFSYGREIHYVDYLESTGTQYILAYNGETDDTFGLKMEFSMEVESDNYPAGFSTTNNKRFLFWGARSTGRWCYGWSNVSTSNTLPYIYLSQYPAGLNNYYTATLNYLNSKKCSFAEDTLYDMSGATETFTNTNFLLFKSYTGGTKARIKFAVVTKGANVIRDYLPAIDENGVGFMFDRVSHTIYDNAGTGVFKYPARETEYVANAATSAYIDLGVKYKPSMSIKGKFTRDAQGESGSVMFLTTSAAQPLIYLPGLSGSSKVDRFVWRRTGYTEQHYYYNFTDYPITEEVYLDAINDKLWLDGNLVLSGMIAGMDGYESPYESTSNMYLFTMAKAYKGNGKIYYAQIQDGTTPIFDLIPAYQDGEAGFYNKIDGTFYKNVSTDASAKLTCGKIKEPEYE